MKVEETIDGKQVEAIMCEYCGEVLNDTMEHGKPMHWFRRWLKGYNM